MGRVLIAGMVLAMLWGGAIALHAQGVTVSEKASEAKPDKPSGTAYYKDGFIIESADGKFSLRMGGVLHFDTRVFADSHSPDSFDIRRGRFDVRGSLYKGDIDHVFRLQLEMADEPYLRNAYWIFVFRPEAQLQVGQFKVPGGGADSISEESHVNFVEYAAATPITPFFDRGFNLQSHFAGNRLQTCVGMVTGTGVDRDVASGDWDSDKDFFGRVFVMPKSGNGLRFAASAERGKQSIFTRRGETGFRTENYESRWFNWSKKYGDIDKRTRYGIEAHFIQGPFTASYEFARVTWSDLTFYADDKGTLDFVMPGDFNGDVHQVWVSYFLTGESKTLDDVFFAWRQPKPKRNLSLKDHTTGGWELVGRYSKKDTDQALFDKGVLDGVQEGYSVTGGLRWLWNPKAKIMFDMNYLKCEKGKGILTETAEKGVYPVKHYDDSEVGFLIRFLLTF